MKPETKAITLYVVATCSDKPEVQSVVADVTPKTIQLRERVSGFGFRAQIPADAKWLKQHKTPQAAINAYIASEQQAVTNAIGDLNFARANVAKAKKLKAEYHG